MNTTIQMNLKNSHAEQKKPLEKEMAIHSSILAWEIPWIEELGGLQSMGLTMGLQRVRYDLAT